MFDCEALEELANNSPSPEARKQAKGALWILCGRQDQVQDERAGAPLPPPPPPPGIPSAIPPPPPPGMSAPSPPGQAVLSSANVEKSESYFFYDC